jgi:peptidoglycan/xylan/chitin deacetylase (PgdA/CDA1 family)
MREPHRDVALTFDDGPGPSTERLLAVLADHGARATFFVLGKNLRGAALGDDGDRAMRIATRAVREGHWLGNHTVSHASALTPRRLLEEVAECDELVRRCYAATGRPRPAQVPVRLPFGLGRGDVPGSLETLERLGRPHCAWTCDFGDWRRHRSGNAIAAEMICHVEWMWAAGSTPILLLHDAGPGDGDGGDGYGVTREATVDAVARSCARLARKGARYVGRQRPFLR